MANLVIYKNVLCRKYDLATLNSTKWETSKSKMIMLLTITRRKKTKRIWVAVVAVVAVLQREVSPAWILRSKYVWFYPCSSERRTQAKHWNLVASNCFKRRTRRWPQGRTCESRATTWNRWQWPILCVRIMNASSICKWINLRISLLLENTSHIGFMLGIRV